MKAEAYHQSVQNCVRRCRRVARIALAVVSLFWIIFGIIAGTQAEGGISALFQDFTNIIPWLAIILLWFIAWKWEILGGLLIIAFSIFMAFHMNVFEAASNEGAMIITPMAMTGFMFTFIGLRILAAKNAVASE